MSKTRPFGSNRCSNCGEYGSHFAPPSLGEPGFFICKGPNMKKIWIKEDGEGDISNIAGHLYFKRREKERAEAKEIEEIRKRVVPATHTGRMATGKK